MNFKPDENRLFSMKVDSIIKKVFSIAGGKIITVRNQGVKSLGM